MTTQSEAQLEVALVRQLVGQGFRLASIQDGDDLLLNLKEELEAFNGHRYSDREFKKVLNHLSKGNFFTKAENLRDRFQLNRDDGTTAYLQFFDSDKAEANRWQVTHQVTQEGTYKNRYDVTVLANGLPIVQIELKKRGMEMKEAFNQIKRYQATATRSTPTTAFIGSRNCWSSATVSTPSTTPTTAAPTTSSRRRIGRTVTTSKSPTSLPLRRLS